jgi:hypothetical protein
MVMPRSSGSKIPAQTQSNVHQFFGQPAAGGDNRELSNIRDCRTIQLYLSDECSINGRPTYRVTFHPKDQAPPAYRTLDRVLKRISGTLWIDAPEFEIARADLELGSEVDFGRCDRLSRKLATMTRPVADGIWLRVSQMAFRRSKLLDSVRIKMRSESTNFRLITENR